MSDNQKDENQNFKDPESAEAKTHDDTGTAEESAREADSAQEDSRDAEIADLKDRLLRTMAEMENLRKRAERDRKDASQYAITGFARDLLDVADNLRRALESIPADSMAAHEDMKPFIEGVEMTERTLLGAFEKNGIERFNPEGEKFDHNFHEAMFEAPTNEHPNGMIVQVVQPGYKIRDRLLRPARVGVARNTEAAQPSEGVDKTV